MAHSDARKAPWYLDLTPSEMETVIAAVPLLLEVARLAELMERIRNRKGSEDEHFELLAALVRHHKEYTHAVTELDAAFPTWRTWLTVEQRAR